MSEELERRITKLSENINLQKTPTIDHARNIIIAAVNGIPAIGGSLASLMDSYIPKQREKRILDFISSLSGEVEKVKDKIREDLINKEEFVFIFEKTFRGILENYQQEKIDCYKAIFINMLIDKDSLSEEEKEVYINILNNLTVRHMRILSILKKHQRGELREWVKQYNLNYNKEEIEYIMDDLRNKGLVPEKGTVYDYSLENNFNRLSNMGKKFINFICIEQN